MCISLCCFNEKTISAHFEVMVVDCKITGFKIKCFDQMENFIKSQG